MWYVSFDNITEVMQVSCPPDEYRNYGRLTILKLFFVEMLLYTVTRFFVRASIILFYLRVFPKDNKLSRILMITMGVNVVYNVAFFFAVVFQCSPINEFWHHWIGEDGGQCINVNVLAWVAAITGLVFDVWLLALPFPQLMALNLHWKKKILGGVMFSVGARQVPVPFLFGFRAGLP